MSTVDDLLASMTLEEKVAQLSGAMGMSLLDADGRLDVATLETVGPAGLGHVGLMPMAFDDADRLVDTVNEIQRRHAESTRLGIPVLFHQCAMPAVGFLGATQFPTGIGLAATWDTDLVRRLGDVVGRESRALGHPMALGPTIDVTRDARWGRIAISFGEDPDLVGALGVAYIRGLQGDDLRHGVLAAPLHFTGYGATDAALNGSAIHVGRRELHDVYARPFEAVVQHADLGAVMTAYGEIDGVPVACSKEVLTTLLRDLLRFEGFTISDYFAINKLFAQFKVVPSQQEAGVRALVAGHDVEAPSPQCYGALLVDAVRDGLVDEAIVDRSCRRVLVAKEKLGLFQERFVPSGSARLPIGTDVDRAAAREAAEKAIVLLKNDGVLPLGPTVGRIAVVGPFAHLLRPHFADYTSVAMEEQKVAARAGVVGSQVGVSDRIAEDAEDAEGFAEAHNFIRELMTWVGKIDIDDEMEAVATRHYPEARSILDAVRERAGADVEVVHAKGCDNFERDTSGFEEAAHLAAGADVVVAVLGEKSGWVADATNGEGRGVMSLDLPGVQDDFLGVLLDTGTPVVVVLLNGRPLSVNLAAERAAAVLECFHPGQEGGRAVASVLFGDVAPSGRLPITIPRHSGQTPIYHAQPQGTGYKYGVMLGTRYTDGPASPLYHFGHGLTYTTFAYEELAVEPSAVEPHGVVTVSCRVANTGERAADEVVQCYWRDLEASLARPVRQLVGFARVPLQPGETRTVTFEVHVPQTAFLDEDMRLVVEPGATAVEVGASSDDVRLESQFEIVGAVTEVSRDRRFIATARVS